MGSLLTELSDLYIHDSTVHAYLKEQEHIGSSDLDTAVGLIRQLVKEKKIYLDDAIRTRNLSTIPMILDPDLTERMTGWEIINVK